MPLPWQSIRTTATYQRYKTITWWIWEKRRLELTSTWLTLTKGRLPLFSQERESSLRHLPPSVPCYLDWRTTTHPVFRWRYQSKEKTVMCWGQTSSKSLVIDQWPYSISRAHWPFSRALVNKEFSIEVLMSKESARLRRRSMKDWWLRRLLASRKKIQPLTIFRTRSSINLEEKSQVVPKCMTLQILPH